MKKKILSILFLMILMILAGLVIFYFSDVFITSTPAFADVVKPLLDSRTITFHMTTTIEMENHSFTHEMDCMYAEPFMMRMMMDDNLIVIFNPQERKMISLQPQEKTAMLFETEGFTEELEKNMAYSLFYDFQELARQARKENSQVILLPESEMGGQPVIGYQIVEADKVTTNAWFDKKTLQPLQIDSIVELGSQGKFTSAMTDFSFDEAFDPSLFSTDIPEEYTVSEMPIDLSGPDEESLIEMFRIWAEHTGGQFPSCLSLDCMGEFFTGTPQQQEQNRFYEQEHEKWKTTAEQIESDKEKISQQTLDLIRQDRLLLEKMVNASLPASERKAAADQHEKNTAAIEALRKQEIELLDQSIAARERATEALNRSLQPTLDRSEKMLKEGVEGSLQSTLSIAQGFAFVQTLPPESNWHYAGNTATFGDFDSPLFWYIPKNSVTYRVIYADLSVKDVAPDDIPMTIHKE